MPAEMTAPRINSNMAPSQSVAGVEVETARGEEADADRDENYVQHLGSPRRPATLAAIGATLRIVLLHQVRALRIDLGQPVSSSARTHNTTNAAQNTGPSNSIRLPVIA